jgi:hypothetical protein
MRENSHHPQQLQWHLNFEKCRMRWATEDAEKRLLRAQARLAEAHLTPDDLGFFFPGR